MEQSFDAGAIVYLLLGQPRAMRSGEICAALTTGDLAPTVDEVRQALRDLARAGYAVELEPGDRWAPTAFGEAAKWLALLCNRVPPVVTTAHSAEAARAPDAQQRVPAKSN